MFIKQSEVFQVISEQVKFIRFCVCVLTNVKLLPAGKSQLRSDTSVGR